MFLDGPLFEAEMRYFLEFNDLLIAFDDEVVSEPEFLSVFLSAGVDVFSGADRRIYFMFHLTICISFVFTRFSVEKVKSGMGSACVGLVALLAQLPLQSA